ncbi:DNA polymerase IV [Klebsiella pneumoniae]|uniref:DNA polymerase IV n=1 Tax=Klebsiella pneumoniae TaxID=573 RepID=A0A2X3GUM9_KLEPN|nr:DNA polymerase IV [Klebsiella pneumoniae]
MDAYKEASNHIREIFSRYTSRIEPLSLDEAYLDVSDSEHCHGSATLIAQEIRQTIERELRLTASAGVAPVKFLAKIASDMNKPNGQFVIAPHQVAEFVRALPLAKNTRRREGIGSEAGKYGPANLWRCAKQRSGHAA